MAVKRKKCPFFQKEIWGLGFKISEDGVLSFVGKADAIENLPDPKIISKLWMFSGWINQYVKDGFEFFFFELPPSSPIKQEVNLQMGY